MKKLTAEALMNLIGNSTRAMDAYRAAENGGASKRSLRAAAKANRDAMRAMTSAAGMTSGLPRRPRSQ